MPEPGARGVNLTLTTLRVNARLTPVNVLPPVLAVHPGATGIVFDLVRCVEGAFGTPAAADSAVDGRRDRLVGHCSRGDAVRGGGAPVGLGRVGGRGPGPGVPRRQRVPDPLRRRHG